MASKSISREDFLEDRQGRTFADVVNDAAQPFNEVLEFFKDVDRQRRMEESEIHHDRAPMAGVVRELESLPSINSILGAADKRRSQRLRQAIGVLIRMIMEQRGWRKTGKKGSLGVRSTKSPGTPNHNVGGLAFWFIRAERYVQEETNSYPSVRNRCKKLEDTSANGKVGAKRKSSNVRTAKRTAAARQTTRKAESK